MRVASVRSGGTARLFFALDLPDGVRARLEDWGRRQRRHPRLRLIPAAATHVTLAFLGRRDVDLVPRLVGALEAVGAGRSAPRLEFGDPEPRPARRPRIYALPVTSAGVGELEAELRDRLVREGLAEPEERPFWPHVTVARVRRAGAGEGAPAGPPPAPEPLPAELREPFDAVRMTLYRSVLQSQGAQYTPLAQVELPSDGRQ